MRVQVIRRGIREQPDVRSTLSGTDPEWYKAETLTFDLMLLKYIG